MSNLLKNKTFEVPACTVCMEEMTENLSSIGCGHVFHSHCIVQSLEYRSACPNCRKRSTAKEIRDLTFAVAVTKLEDTDRIQFLDSLKQADQENYLKLITQNEEMYKEVKTKTNKIAELKEEIENKENLLVSQGEMIRALNNLKSDWKVEKQALILQKEAVQIENEKIVKVNRELDKKVVTLERETKDYGRLKKIVDNVHDNEDEFLKSLRERATPQEQATTFYDFLRMKKGELKKAKDDLQKMGSELSLYKEKVSSLESALKQKSQADKPTEKRFEIADIKRRVSLEDKIIPEKTVRSAKPQSRVDLGTSNLLLNNSLHHELDFFMLEKDMLNTSFREGRDKTNETQEVTKKPTEMIRPMKSLIYPPGMTKTTPEVKSINKWTSQTSQTSTSGLKFSGVKLAANDLNRSKQTDFMNLKKVKLNNEDLGPKPNVQQKISSIFGSNS